MSVRQPNQEVLLSTDSLWRQFRAGSPEAYALIYQQHFFYLLDFGKKISTDRELVKDTIQDLFIELWNSRTRLSDTSSVRFYLANALKYKLYRQAARESRSLAYSGDATPVIPWEEHRIQEEVSQARQQKIYRALLRLLTARQREAVQLKFYQELTNDEIATRMHISKEAVYNTISKAIKVLRKDLDRAALLLLFF